jgi:hypothetical protein
MYKTAWLRDEESGAAITTSRLAVWINGNVLLSIGRELRAWIARRRRCDLGRWRARFLPTHELQLQDPVWRDGVIMLRQREPA